MVEPLLFVYLFILSLASIGLIMCFIALLIICLDWIISCAPTYYRPNFPLQEHIDEELESAIIKLANSGIADQNVPLPNVFHANICSSV